MPPRKFRKADPEIIIVRAPEDMGAIDFMLHCRSRHPDMRFRERRQHEMDHEIHAEKLTHMHNDPGESDAAETED